MITDDQKAVTVFLSDAASYGLSGAVEMIETHISRIFLVGDRAFKLKRAVKLPYVDFSTFKLRLNTCLREVELNARTSPDLYLGVRLIHRNADGSLGFGQKAELMDAVVEMKRFDQACLFDHMAAAGKLSPMLMTDLTRMIVAFHKHTSPVWDEKGADNISNVLDINENGFKTSRVFSTAEQALINRRCRAAFKRHAPLLDQRARDGKIRFCHGDLHLSNLCLVDDQPRLFDCIEFNDRIATVDILYDLAFLLMDLWHLGFKNYTNLVANRYTDDAKEDGGFVLLPFFMAVRAVVRAHISATQAQEAGGDERLAKEARSYYELAMTLLHDASPMLIAIGGFSGSGKTTLADSLAPEIGSPPGARILESDRIRKMLHGVSAETRLDNEAYRPDVSQRVYAEMVSLSEQVLASGSSVVTDAVYEKPQRRRDIEAATRKTGADFTGIWLDAPFDTLRQRLKARRGGQSDANLDVLQRQIDRGASDIDWVRIDAS
ncbi:AAA family ATPase [Cohaesibacter celericrescens]|uniref:Aminoglycoside phosphotransferase n=1 Tax=Cohaesibacter celericrescens TaxID=2067669 RepID=A0A2N5XVH7_9HYPH|nr:bifunctional aminoglycoside phosphotransferase/ATP-binding protein [Cohaesibacter celericrescens]PLW78467.1 aminoglycoside phosphotransferase [Cohaesibacter celericrescens]